MQEFSDIFVGFLPNKPGTLHPVASATFKALMCLYLSPGRRNPPTSFGG
jgi:hypothetical protein